MTPPSCSICTADDTTIAGICLGVTLPVPSPLVPAVVVDRLVVRYGALTAVDHLSFTAEAGQVTAVLGPNGAGKTSTIEVLEGYREPTSGVVRVTGLDPIAHHDELVTRMGVMLQDGGVYPGIRAVEAVRLFASFYGKRAVTPPGELLASVGLSARAAATWRQLSGGEQQRLSLALALAGEPEIAFLDEPTASVDVAGRQVVREVIRRLAQRGAAVVLTTHELDEAERLADKVVIIDHGRLVGEGSPAELRTSTGAAAEVRFAASPGLDVANLAEALDAPVTETTPGEYVVAAPGTPALVADLTAWLAARDEPLADLRAGRQRLEDVFLHLTTGLEPPAGPPQPPPSGRARRRRGRT
jgi:ABC-2 type transport system ATP-binding protein